MSIKKFYIKRSKNHFRSLRVISQRVTEVQAIKLEPAFIAENEEAQQTAGYCKHFVRGRKSAGPGRSFFRENQGRQHGRQQQNRSINPVGSDSKVRTCRYCGSFRHLVDKYPHS